MTRRRHRSVVRVSQAGGIGERLKQFFLSLLNTTLLLGIVFMALALTLVGKLETFTENVLNDVRLSLLHEIDDDVKGTLGAIGEAEQELKLISDRLTAIVEHPERVVSPRLFVEVRALRDELNKIQKTADTLPLGTADVIAQRLNVTNELFATALSGETQRDMQQLSSDVMRMQRTLAELTSSRTAVSDHAIRSIATATANAIISIRGCSAGATGQNQ
ncbi:MAG: hypothetical protein RIC14_12680 [Filomicrobium sp.]